MSTEIELLSEIEIKIMNGTVLSIADIEVTFKDILENEYGVLQEDLTSYYQRRYRKDLILDTIPHAKCVPQKDPRKPHLIYSTLFDKDILSNTLEEENLKSDMNCIFKDAKVIRQSIFEFRKNKLLNLGKDFQLSDEDVPAELFSLINGYAVDQKEKYRSCTKMVGIH